MLVKKLLGKEVIGSHGDKIGKVSDIDIDLFSGKIKTIIIGAGIGKKYKIKLDDIVTTGDTMIIRFNTEELAKKSKKSG
ncbi:MAG: PRC-barrel domain-containing protein [Dehalococcoidia bacterium]|nr:PRC-barrel domain-containing protein [Dehalococcoidia bacterium]MDD5493387.1 PRC-barrel domain-containing protein [Dehalococcoidia bacterium]